MQPTYISISTLFGSQTRHTVPLFQRPYVWGRDEQWEPLWEDLSGLCERLSRREGEATVAGHFLGTVVLEQMPNATGSLPCRQVIDGQQRLTTLQIMLKAAEHALTAVEASVAEGERPPIAIARRQLAFLTENPAFSAEEEKYKVWPTNEDRAAFKAVMDSTADAGVAGQTGRMAEAYNYFRQTFIPYLAGAGTGAGGRAQIFAAALKDHLRIIVLDLDVSDEPQAIFETLNAHGTPLLPADLMKNWLLWEATRQKIELVPLYEAYWRPFDREHEYWRARVGTGHAARARVDTFLQNWLTKTALEPVSAKHLYDRFLRQVPLLKSTSADERVDVDALMAGIRQDADRYERIDKPTGKTRFDLFLRRLQVLDVVVLHPLLLALMERAGSDQADLDDAAVALESYLVRRMVCGYQTRGYGALALTLLKAIAEVPAGEPVGAVIREQLRQSATGNDTWPDDARFHLDWTRRRFYNGLRRDRVLMILQALEESYQSKAHKAEPLMSFDWSKLQIEHVMPQNWQQYWPMTEVTITPAERDLALHGIGNLTLVSERLNPSLSNGPWAHPDDVALGKREALRKHSRLELNRRLLEQHQNWDEAGMLARAEELFKVAREIWPPCPTESAPTDAATSS